MIQGKEINIRAITTKDLQPVAELYGKVFAGEPWNEFTRCPSCGRFFGLQTAPGNPCQQCNTDLELAYPLDATSCYIKKEIERPYSSALVAELDSQAVGFGWAFRYRSPPDFAGDKYKTYEMMGLIGQVFRQNGICGGFKYISEIGVTPQIRGWG